MKYGAIGENPLERLVLMTGQAPTPFIDTFAFLMARTLMAATKLGIFEALAGGPRAAAEIARQCGTHPEATRKLLDTLTSQGYLRQKAERYALPAFARKWLLKDSPSSLRDVILMRYVDWEWMSHMEQFITTGQPLDIHGTMSADDWGSYQRGMRALASVGVGETVRRTPVPAGARAMLDIGGSHGYYSVAFCRKYPQLHATILDLPEAVAHAAPILAREGMGERVTHRAGNALADDLGTEQYDMVFMAQLVHHFDDATNRMLMRKIARALRPGGAVVVQQGMRVDSPDEGGGFIWLLNLYFALTSDAGTWSYDEIAGWQRDAGLVAQKPIKFMLVPGVGEQIGAKPAA